MADTLLGSTTKPTYGNETATSGFNNQMGIPLTLPAGGPWQLVRGGAWLRGWTGTVNVRMAVWKQSDNSLLGYSASQAVSGAADSKANSAQFESDYTTGSGYQSVAGGTALFVGWTTDQSSGRQFATNLAGSHEDLDTGGSTPISMSGSSNHARTPGAYLYYRLANSAPTAPTLNSPIGGARALSLTPTLNFTPHDPDADSHTGYTYQIDNNSDFSSPLESIEVLGTFTDNVAINRVCTISQTPGTTYYWRVKTKDAASGYGPYSASTTFVQNSDPSTPSSLVPTGNAIITGADLTPDLQFTYSDPNADAGGSKQVQVANDSGFTSIIFDSGKVSMTQASGTTVTTTCTTTLTRGNTYYWRAKAWDTYDYASAYSSGAQFRVNQLPTVTLLTPNDANNKLAKMVYTAGSGWAAPRMEVSWQYTDAFQSQVQYDLEIATSTTPTASGGSPSSLIVSGAQSSAASTVIGAPSAEFVESNYYFVRVRVNDGLEWSSYSGYFECRVRWGLDTFKKDVNISGAAPTAWSVLSLNTTTVSTNAITLEYNSDDDGAGTGFGAWKSDISLITKRKWIYYRAWFTAWGTSPATRPQLLDITIQASGFVAQPDFWFPSPILNEGGSVELGKFVFGTQSLKMTGDGTTQIIREQVRVEENTNYMFHGRIESIGNSGAQYTLSDTDLGASILNMNTALTADAAFEQYVTGPWNSGNRTAVWVQARITGSSSTAAFFDAVMLHKGTVAAPYMPAPIGSKPSATGSPAVLDAGGVQVDGTAGGIFRLRPSVGTQASVIELGADGFTQGGVAGFFVPSGVIVMWSGETTTIPTGWFLCDGANGTPDLRDRFIIGADTTNEGTSGGTVSASAALATHATHATHSAHSNHVFTQPSGHSAHAALSGHAHEVPMLNAGDEILPSVFGTGTSRTRSITASMSAAGSSFAVYLSQSVGAGTPDAHSAHSGGAVDAHSAHNAHDAHDVHAIPKFWRLAFIMKG